MAIELAVNQWPRMTKRAKYHNPRQNLTKSEAQQLSALVRDTLEELEYTIRMSKHISTGIHAVCGRSDKVDIYFKQAQKLRVKSNKLAKIQNKLKKGLE